MFGQGSKAVKRKGGASEASEIAASGGSPSKRARSGHVATPRHAHARSRLGLPDADSFAGAQVCVHAGKHP